MKARNLTALAFVLALASPAAAQNYSATPGSGLTFGAKSSASVLYPYFIGCDATTVTQCWVVDASGRLTVNLASGSTIAVTQATAANLNATVVGTGTFATQSTLQPSATTAIGKVDPNTIGNWGLAASTQNGSTPTNGQLVMAQFNTSPTTVTSGNVSPLQMDNAGNLLVNIKAGAGSGGTAIADNSVFTTGTTNETPIGCYNGTPTTTSGHVGIWSCTAAGSGHVTVDNANANGRATSANSSPVVPSAAPTTWHLIAANSTNATSVKASATTLLGCQLGGVGSTPAFLKIYNKASSPTVGTDTPVKTLIIPAASTAANGAGSNINFGPGGLTLGTGFAAAVTGVITDADTTAVAAATFAINCDYE